MEEPKYYDIRHVSGVTTHIEIENGTIESAGSSFLDIALLRVLGTKGWGLVTIENFASRTKKDIDGYIREALGYSSVTEEKIVIGDAPSGMLGLPGSKESPADVSLEEKCSLLVSIEAAARIDGIVSTHAAYSESSSTVSFTDSCGHEYSYPVCRSGYGINAVAGRGGNMQAARESERTMAGLNMYHKEHKGLEAAERAIRLLDAAPARGGKMNAVLDQELAGVFAHEAVGHASEGDLVKEGVSVLKGRVGETIGNASLSVTDDPTLPRFGFMPLDAEGVMPKRTEIIKGGVLNAYLHNRQTLALIGDGDAGHARAEAGAVPQVRMSNTFIENGDSDYNEIISECGSGVLLKGSRGGQVDPGRGVFQFNAEYGYIIDKGELAGMVRDVSLSGDILLTMHNIVLCGNDLKMNEGYCGKGGQAVPVSDGSPHVLLMDAVVGGCGD